MAFFGNFGVNHALGVTGLESLVRHTTVASAQYLAFPEFAEDCTFLHRKQIGARYETMDGHFIAIRRPSGNNSNSDAL